MEACSNLLSPVSFYVLVHCKGYVATFMAHPKCMQSQDSASVPRGGAKRCRLHLLPDGSSGSGGRGGGGEAKQTV